jgi:hypothetical protein
MGVALGPERTTRWLEVSVAGADEGFLWLVPVAPGARVDTTSHAWLDALDAATRPTMLPPSAPSTCGAAVGPVQVTIPSPREFVSPVAVGVAGDVPTLSAMVARSGRDLSAEDLAPWGPVLEAGLDVLVVWYERGHPDATTESLRIVESSETTLDLPSTASPHLYTAATMFLLAGGPVQAGPVALTVDPGSVLWGLDNQTNYAELRQNALESAAGTAWLTDSAMPNRLFQPVTVEGDVALPPLLERYFSLAERTAPGSVAQCSEAASMTGSLGGSVAPLCPPGALAVVAGPSVCPPSLLASGAVSPLPFACGEAVDAAYALAGLVASDAWLTRATGVLVPTGAGGTAVNVGNAGDILSAVIVASGYEAPCMVASGVASATPTPTPPPPPDVGTAYDPTPLLNAGEAAAEVVDTASDGSSGGCDGDSSDSSSDGGGCDSSSSSADSSSGGCSGDSSSDPSPDCSVHKRRHARGEAVRWLMLGVIGIAFARRSTRGRSVSRTSER